GGIRRARVRRQNPWRCLPTRRIAAAPLSCHPGAARDLLAGRISFANLLRGRGQLAMVVFCTRMGLGFRRDDRWQMLSQAQIAQYRYDGYLFPFPALSLEELAQSNAGLARYEKWLDGPVNQADRRWRSAA